MSHQLNNVAKKQKNIRCISYTGQLPLGNYPTAHCAEPNYTVFLPWDE